MRTRSEFPEILVSLAGLSKQHPTFATDTVSLESNFDSLYYYIVAAAAKYSRPATTAAASNTT